MKKTFKTMFAFMLVVVMAVALFGTMASADALVNVKFVDADGNAVEGASAIVPETAEALAAKGVVINPGEGNYVASVKVDGSSVMGCVEADLESTEVVVDFAADEEDDGLPVVSGMTIVVTVAELPEEVTGSAVAVTPYGSHTYEACPASVSEKDGVFTVAIGDTDMDGAYYEGTYVVLANGAVVEVENGDSFEAVLPFTVKSIYKAVSIVSFSGPYDRENPIPSEVSQTVDGVTTEADVEVVDGAFKFDNVVVTVGGDVLDEDEYYFYSMATLDPIIPTNLTIAAPSVLDAVYNGEALTVTAEPTVVGLNAADKVTVTYKAIPAAPGTYAVEIDTYKIVDGSNVDRSAYYNVTLTNGSAVISPAPITVAAKDSTVEYDGAAHTANGYDITAGKLFGTDSLNVTYDGSATNVSEGKVQSVIKTADVTGAGAGCYTVTVDDTKGSVTVTARPITLTVKNATATATGSEITVSNVGAVVSSGSLVSGDALDSITTSGKGTSAGETPINGSNPVIKNGTTDVTANYAVTIVPGKLTITPSASATKGTITVTFSGSKTYDGKELTQTYTVTMDEEAKKTVGSVKVEGATVGPDAITKYMTDADVTISLIGTDGKTTLDKSQYNVVVVPGNVIIAKQTLTIKPSDATKKYDGYEYIGKINASSDFYGSKITVTANVYPYTGNTKTQAIAVGQYVLKIDASSIKVVDAKNNDITKNFDINSTAEATLKVTATIGTANYSKSAGGTVTINATLPRVDLASVVVDGKTLTKDTDYTVNPNSGNTVVTFKNEFLKTLAEGTHSVVYYYNVAGSISTNLTVTATGSTTSTQAAQTGDNSNVGLWIAILAIAFAAIVAVVVVLLKQRKKSQVEG